jgi:vitamin B12 transporter
MVNLSARLAFALQFGALALATAQSVDPTRAVVPRSVRGIVISRGTPLAGVNVFDLATLAGAVTGDNGAFVIPLEDTLAKTARLTARRIGYKPADTVITNLSDSVVLTLERLTALAPITVLAGRFTANAAERSVTLTPLEVMTTPGGSGDVNSAVKTLPGVQNVDEGSGLFVRGGDFTETRMYIEGAPMFTAYQFEAPTGSVAGTINPFLTDGITFSSGGFGANWGNALSGIVDLRSQGRPQSTYASVNATILSVGAGAAARLPHGLGWSATAGMSDLALLFAVNGSPRQYRPPPRGSTFSTQGVWEYSPTGRVKVFALRQQNAMGVQVDDPAVASTYLSNRTSDIVVASLRDTVGRWRPFLNASTSGLGRSDAKGVFDSRSHLRSWQAHGESAYELSARLTASAGVEAERIGARYDVRFPASGYDPGAGAPSSRSTLDRASVRDAEWGQLDTRPLASAQLVLGLRSDRSTFATARTTDPRLSAAWVPIDSLTVTASWGVYHQVADPAFLDQSAARVSLPALRAEMSIVGVQLGGGARFVRAEAWRKRYGDLVALTRDFATVPRLTGRATGVDLFVRTPSPFGTRVRLTWSSAWSRRTDPNSLRDAPAPFDITNSVTAVIERDWSNGWHVGVAQRLATGRPFTDVIGAAYDSTLGVFVPAYGAPNAGRLPAYRRADIAISRATVLEGGRFLVIFGAIQNPFNTPNLFGYTWTRDYAARVPVPSMINRTLFIGANLVRSRNP